MELRKSLWEEVLENRRHTKIAYLNYRQVVVRGRRPFYHVVVLLFLMLQGAQ